MPTISGTEKPKTYNCVQCGAFLWHEGVCDPCKGHPTEAEVPEEKAVTYGHSEVRGRVIARRRGRG